MRVISGTARSIKLNTLKGQDTRPTTDRIKETLFNIIGSQIVGTNFLDLFCGSGAIGIEALSRGAHYACFVDNNIKLNNIIIDNLTRTKLIDKSDIIIKNVDIALQEINIIFDYIFLDPPYNNDKERQTLEFIKRYKLADKNTIIIIEADINTDFEYVKEIGYNIKRVKEYKTNKHIFLNLE